MSIEKIKNGLEKFDRYRRYSKKIKHMNIEEMEMLKKDVKERTFTYLSNYSDIVAKLSDSNITKIDELYAYIFDLIILMGGNLKGLNMKGYKSKNPLQEIIKDFFYPIAEDFKDTFYNSQGNFKFTGKIYVKIETNPIMTYTNKGKSGKNYYLTRAISKIRVPNSSIIQFKDKNPKITLFEQTTDDIQDSLRESKLIKNHIYVITNPTCTLKNLRNEKYLESMGVEWELGLSLRNIEDLGEDFENIF